MLNTATIKTSRRIYVEESIDVAIISLDSFRHLIGQPVTVRYRKEDNTIDTLFAIGIKDGVGRDCYSLISTGEDLLVNSVLEEIPDVTEMVNGEIYLCKHNNAWELLSLNSEGSKIFNPSIPNPKIIREITTGYRWFLVGENLRREDDFIPSNEINTIIYRNLNLLYKPELIVKNRIEVSGQTLVDPEFDIQAIDYSKQDITNKITLHIVKSGTETALTHEVYNGKLKIFGSFSSTTEFIIKAKYNLGENTIVEFTPEENLRLIFTNPTYIITSESPEILDPTEETEIFSLWEGGKLELDEDILFNKYLNLYIPSTITITELLNENDCSDISGNFSVSDISINGIAYKKYKSNALLSVNAGIVVLSDSYIPDIQNDFDKKLIIYDLKKQAIINTVPIELTQEEYNALEIQGKIDPNRTYMISMPEE